MSFNSFERKLGNIICSLSKHFAKQYILHQLSFPTENIKLRYIQKITHYHQFQHIDLNDLAKRAFFGYFDISPGQKIQDIIYN